MTQTTERFLSGQLFGAIRSMISSRELESATRTLEAVLSPGGSELQNLPEYHAAVAAVDAYAERVVEVYKEKLKEEVISR
ncbi:MAG: hypothetical protein Q8P81_02945 [Nanoarchaeota archaeon]|nr:hypothetical protein [Nanoarchaeota archaeon]